MTETIDLNRELRRYQNTLVVAGTAVIAFGAWSIIKILMILGANLDRIGELLLRPWTIWSLFLPPSS